MKRLLFASIILATLLALYGCQTATPPEVTDAPNTPAVIDTTDEVDTDTVDTTAPTTADSTGETEDHIEELSLTNVNGATTVVRINKTTGEITGTTYNGLYQFTLKGDSLFTTQPNLYSIADIEALAGTEIHTVTFTDPDILGISCGPSNVLNLYVTQENKYLVSVDGVIFSKDLRVLTAFPTGRNGSYTVPDGVERIDSNAFNYARIEHISIPSSVKYATHAFHQAYSLEVIYFPNVDKQAEISLISVLETKDPINQGVKRYKQITAVYGGNNVSDPAFSNFAIANVVKELGAKENGFSIENGILTVHEGVEALWELNLEDLFQNAFTKVILPASLKSVSGAYMLNTQAFEANPDNEYLKSVDGIIYSNRIEESDHYDDVLLAFPKARTGEFRTDKLLLIASSAFRNSSLTSVYFNTNGSRFTSTLNLPNAFKGCNASVYVDSELQTGIYR